MKLEQQACAKPSGRGSKRGRGSGLTPKQLAKPKVVPAKKNTAAVAAGTGKNVDTGASRCKKPVHLSPADESVNPPKRRKPSRRKEEEEPAGEESGNEVQRDKKQKKEKKEKKTKQSTKWGTFISARGCGGSPAKASDGSCSDT